MSDDELTFASASTYGVHYARCWPCMTNACPAGWHTWADEIDVQHALSTGQPDPTTKRCGCPCTEGPVRDPSDGERDFDLDDPSLTADPCPVCGESGACGYDAEGRSLIHAVTDDEAAGE